MKVCIIYNGAYNFFELAIKNQQKKIFNYLEKNNIDYDIYFCVAPEINVKYHDKKKLINVLDYINSQFKDYNFYKEYHNKFAINNIERETVLSEWYIINFKITQKYIEKIIHSIFDKNRIKLLEIDEYSGKLSSENLQGLHLHDNYFNTFTYNRLDKIYNFIKNNNINYDKYIVLRPELVFSKYFKIEDYLQSDKFIIGNNYRLDFFQMYKKLLPELMSKEVKDIVYKKIKKVRDLNVSFEKYKHDLDKVLNDVSSSDNTITMFDVTEYYHQYWKGKDRSSKSVPFEHLFSIFIVPLIKLKLSVLCNCDKIQVASIDSGSKILKEDNICLMCYDEYINSK